MAQPAFWKYSALIIIFFFRTATARGKAEQADIAAVHAREDAQMAVSVAKEFGGPSDTGNLQPAKTAIGSSSEPTVAKPTVANNLLNVKNHNAAVAAAAAVPASSPSSSSQLPTAASAAASSSSKF